MADNSDSWEDIAEFIQDAARQMREYGLTVLDVEHGGSRVRMKIDKPRNANPASGGETIVVQHSHAPVPRYEPEQHVISSPMIGTFYASPGPGEPAFVQEGDGVEIGQVVGIIEAMKIMNEITSDLGGVVARILVRNAQAVEYGQPLFEIQPSE
jgi:acetyl-CoA carboxylase biotin carboxyl carrier protein